MESMTAARMRTVPWATLVRFSIIIFVSDGELLGVESVQLGSCTDLRLTCFASGSTVCNFNYILIFVAMGSMATAPLILRFMDEAVDAMKALWIVAFHRPCRRYHFS